MENLGIYKAIIGVMQDVGVVGKNKEFKSNYGNYKFRGIDDVMNALHPAMVEHRVFVVPEILSQEREFKTMKSGSSMVFSICKIKYTFFTEDGSFIEAIVTGEGMDTGDKATNKAMSIAYKYACFQVFCIPTEEMIDPDGERPEQEEKKSMTKKSKAIAQEKTQADDADTDKEQHQNAENTVTGDTKITDAMLKTIGAELKRTGVKTDVILSLFKTKALEDMTIDQFKKAMKKFQATPDLQEEAS